MAAVIAVGGIFGGITIAQAVSMGASAAGGVASILKIVQELHAMGLKPTDKVPESHLQRFKDAVGQLLPIHP